MSSIPSVSLKSLMSDDAEVITHLENSLENIGFFILKDHDLNLELVRDAFSLSKDLFNLPFKIKKKYHVKGSNGARGYTPYGIETALNEDVPDQKEFWHQGSTTNHQLMPNLYIDELDGFSFVDNLHKCTTESVKFYRPSHHFFEFSAAFRRNLQNFTQSCYFWP